MEQAWLGGDTAQSGVLAEVDGERIVSLTTDVRPPDRATILPGLTLPGLVNAHSHAFHRALRSRVQTERGSFWTWRERMYAVAARLDPENYHRLARAVYAEMALAGITTVGEFHYVHHRPDGTPYAEPTAMAEALRDAARDAGIRLTVLDTCYLRGGFSSDGYRPLAPEQRRFGDGDAAGWAKRASRTHARLSGGRVRVGAAIHSVRAVPPAAVGVVAAWAQGLGVPLHAHVSEQPAENIDCLRVHGRTPTAVLAEHGALGPHMTAVHATHPAPEDVALLGAGGTTVCFCVTTERDLADGIGPAPELAAAGVALNLGSDSHAVIDMFEEARGVELDERLRSRGRGAFTAAELLHMATDAGAVSLGWPDAGAVRVGALADFTTVSLDTVRTAGSGDAAIEAAVFAATAADVATVVVGGEVIVAEGRHRLVGDVGAELASAIAELTEQRPVPA
jgi:formiminoglutamate deiminase